MDTADCIAGGAFVRGGTMDAHRPPAAPADFAPPAGDIKRRQRRARLRRDHRIIRAWPRAWPLLLNTLAFAATIKLRIIRAWPL